MKIKNLKFRVIICFLILAIVASTINFKSINAQINSNLPVSYIDENFPSSYMPYINALKAEHPNWVFKAVHTGLDWNTVVSHESYEVNASISTVEDIYGSEWKKDGQNNYVDGNYVTASKGAVAYVLDPRNFINNNGIFMFEALRFVEGVQTPNAVQGVLASTPMGSSYKDKYKLYGEWKDLGTTYADLIYSISKEVGINPVHIASRIRQENSGNILNNVLINGDYGVYNFFNIGAYDSSSGNAVTNGVNTARTRGWTNISSALRGGIEYIYNNYVKWGQNTIYFERFDVNNPGQAKYLLGTGYMTNIFAPRSEAQITYKAYANCGILNNSFEFDIPVYENMPAYAVSSPISEGVYFVDDNTQVYLDDPSDTGVPDVFSVRSGPDTSYPVIDTITELQEGGDNRTKFTRVGIGQNTLYDKIQLTDGRIGYVMHKWLYEYTYTKVESVSLDTTYTEVKEGQSFKLNAIVSPSNAQNKNVSWTSSDTNVATVDQNGNVTALNEGVATIMVKTQDMSKSAICTVNVYGTKVTGVSFPVSNYKINVGDSLTLYPKIEPQYASNKNYRLTISDTTLANMNGNTITAIKSGTLIVEVITDDGGLSARTTIEINPSQEGTEKYVRISDSTLKIEEDVITGVKIGTTISTIKSKIDTNDTYEIRDINGNVLPDDGVVGTGTGIYFSSTGKEYHFVIYGDVDGSGIINSRDLLVLQRYILGKTELNEYQVKASIIDKVSDIPKAADLLKIQRAILGMYVIEQ